MKHLINNVFNPIGNPEFTYVSRDGGEYEKSILEKITDRELCLIQGPSKTGKTTLYERVAKENHLEIIPVSCRSQGVGQLWKEALERINAYRKKGITQTQSKGKGKKTQTGGGIDVKILKINRDSEKYKDKEKSDTVYFEEIQADEGAAFVANELSNKNIILAIEEIQNLDDEALKAFAQDCKLISDSKNPIILVSTSNRSGDILKAEKCLVGRLEPLKIKSWKSDELQEIIKKGFEELNVPIDENLKKRIANESVGLPLVTQRLCLQLFRRKGYNDLENDTKNDIEFSEDDLVNTFHSYANGYLNDSYNEIYNNFQELDDGLDNKFNIFRAIFMMFALYDPIRTSITVNNIIMELKQQNIPDLVVPSKESIINAIKKLEKINFGKDDKLIEYESENQKLHICEPLFLFYLRWNNKEHGARIMKNIIEKEILKKIENEYF